MLKANDLINKSNKIINEAKKVFLEQDDKVNMSKLKNEIQAAVNKYFKDDKDVLEHIYVDTKKDKFGRDVLEVRAELGYISMVELADYLDKIVTKYDKYAYFEQETSGIMIAVFEPSQKNEEVTKSNYKSIINELEGIFKKFAGNGLELGHKVKPNSFDLPFDTSLSVALKDKTKLEPVKAALKKVIDKYGAKKVAHDNDFAYNFGKSNRDGIYVGWNWNANNAFVGYAVNPDFDAKALSESSQMNEASSLQALNKELANNVETLYFVAKHVRDRFKYRTLQNMSYDEAQAEKIYDQIEDVIEDAVKKLATINSKVIG